MFKLKVHSNEEKNIDNIEIYIERYIYRGIYAWYVRLDGYIVYIYSWVYLGGWKEVFVFYHIYIERHIGSRKESLLARGNTMEIKTIMKMI